MKVLLVGNTTQNRQNKAVTFGLTDREIESATRKLTAGLERLTSGLPKGLRRIEHPNNATMPIYNKLRERFPNLPPLRRN
jgi:hypothetical protein